jgi:hypothetical protein
LTQTGLDDPEDVQAGFEAFNGILNVLGVSDLDDRLDRYGLVAWNFALKMALETRHLPYNRLKWSGTTPESYSPVSAR